VIYQKNTSVHLGYITILLSTVILTISPVFTKAEDIVDSLIQRGIALYEGGRFRESIAAYDSALSRRPRNLDIVYEKALSLCALGEYNDARILCEKIIRTDSLSHYEAYVLEGTILDHIGEPDSSIVFYSNALRRYSSSYGLYYNRGIVYSREEKYHEAENDFICTLTLNPTHSNSLFALAETCIRTEQRAKAVLVLMAYLLQEPGSSRSSIVFERLTEQCGFHTPDIAPYQPTRLVPPVVGEDTVLFQRLNRSITTLSDQYGLHSERLLFRPYYNMMSDLLDTISVIPFDTGTFWGNRFASLLSFIARSQYRDIYIHSIARNGFPIYTRHWLSTRRQGLAELDSLVARYLATNGADFMR
jgi:tetratricopeptide (TPR) repeat protein